MTTLPAPPRVYGYARVSTDEQGRSGLGVDAQQAAIAAEAARHGWTVEQRADVGVSGSVRPEDRPALAGILDALTAGDALVCAKLDRLGRNALDVLRLAERARADGWRLVLLDLGLDTATPVGAFTLAALAAVAQLERDLIAARTRDALAAAKRRGARLGAPTRVPAAVRDRVAVLRADGYTLRAIAARLNADDVPTVGGGPWWASTVRGVLHSAALDAEAAAAAAARAAA